MTNYTITLPDRLNLQLLRHVARVNADTSVPRERDLTPEGVLLALVSPFLVSRARDADEEDNVALVESYRSLDVVKQEDVRQYIADAHITQSESNPR